MHQHDVRLVAGGPRRRTGATARRAASPARRGGPTSRSTQLSSHSRSGMPLAGRPGRRRAGRSARRSAPGPGCRPGGRGRPPCPAGAGPPRRTCARGSSGIPSSGVCVLMNRRCGWAASRSTPSACGSTSRSSQGDSSVSGAGSSGVPEDQQRADHLHPGRAALGPGADHDVAVAEREAGPAGAVLVVGSVTVNWRGHRWMVVAEPTVAAAEFRLTFLGHMRMPG